MATPEPDPTAPKAFISYSWDDDAHKEWVKQLATRLRADGVDVTLDRWHAAPGDQIPAFMERAVRENDFVIAVCTPRFKERSDGRGGGVGYEGDIMTAYAFTGGDKRKFIPVLRRGSWIEAAPTWLLGRAKIDLSGARTPTRSTRNCCGRCTARGKKHRQSVTVRTSGTRRGRRQVQLPRR